MIVGFVLVAGLALFVGFAAGYGVHTTRLRNRKDREEAINLAVDKTYTDILNEQYEKRHGLTPPTSYTYTTHKPRA